METLSENSKQLSNLQLEFLKSLRYLTSEKQLNEIRSLLRFYYTTQLDEAIERAENAKEYTAEVYNGWLRSKKSDKLDNTGSV